MAPCPLCVLRKLLPNADIAYPHTKDDWKKFEDRPEWREVVDNYYASLSYYD